MTQRDLTRADVLRVIQLGGSPAPDPVAVPAPDLPTEGPGLLGGIGQGMDGLESVLGMLERVEPLFTKFSEQFMKIRQWEGSHQADPQGQGQGEDPESYMDVDANGYLYVDEMPGPQRSRAPRPESRPTAQAENAPANPPPTAGGAESVTPISIYQIILESLSALPEDMTIGEALKMAREQKEVVLSEIEGKLKQIFGAK